MKHLFVFLLLVFGLRLVASDTIALESPTPASSFYEAPIRLEPYRLGLSFGLAFPNYWEPEESFWNWIPKPSINPAIHGEYELNPHLYLRLEIANYHRRLWRNYFHPEPYVMEMDATISQKSVRLPLSLNYNLPGEKRPIPAFIGIGAYIDLPYKSELKREKRYIFEDEIVRTDISSELPLPDLGLLLRFGFQDRVSSVEIRLTQGFLAHNPLDLSSKSLMPYSIEFLVSVHLQQIFNKD